MEKKTVIELKCAIDKVNFGYVEPNTDNWKTIEPDLSNLSESAKSLGVPETLVRTLIDFSEYLKETMREDFISLYERIDELEKN